MFGVVIIDDDPFSQVVIEDLLHTSYPDFSIVAKFSKVQEALLALPKIEADLLFLDMELEDGFGFDILKQLEEIDFEVIITTMHDSYMLQAIKHSAIDYLMKPLAKKDFAEAITRFQNKRSKVQKHNSDNSNRAISHRRLVIPNQNGLVLVEISDIIRMESEGAYTRITLVDGKTHLTSKNLGFYESQLAVHDFLRVHHSHLISLMHIKNYVKGEGGYVIMSDNTMVEVSRRKKEDFMRKLGL